MQALYRLDDEVQLKLNQLTDPTKYKVVAVIVDRWGVRYHLQDKYFKYLVLNPIRERFIIPS